LSGGGEAELAKVVDVRLTPDTELDAEDIERLTRQLRAELSQLDLDSVSLVAGGPAPDGAKAVDPITMGAIVVAMSASGGVFPSVIETVRDWLNRHAARHRVSVTIDGDTIVLEKATAGQRQDLLDAYVRRYSGGRSG
jgi:hypothetical protein